MDVKGERARGGNRRGREWRRKWQHASLTPPNLTLSDTSSRMGVWAPSTAHNDHIGYSKLWRLVQGPNF